jgi:hypothetical protein
MFASGIGASVIAVPNGPLPAEPYDGRLRLSDHRRLKRARHRRHQKYATISNPSGET